MPFVQISALMTDDARLLAQDAGGDIHMHMQFRSDLPTRWRGACKLGLALSVLFGCVLGTCVGNGAGLDVLSLMRASAESRVSIVGLLVVFALPFLLAAFAVLFSKPWLAAALCAWKAFCFCFCAVGICRAFEGSGWLVRLLLLFSGGCMLPVLIWFCLRQMGGAPRRHILYDLAVCAAFAVLIGCLDHCYVSPFLAMLIEI